MKTVIFADDGVAGTAQIAGAYFSAMADPQKARAVVAGTTLAESYHPRVTEALSEASVVVEKAKVVILTPELAKGAEWLVTFAGSKVAANIQGPQRLEWPPMESPESKQSFNEVEPIRDSIAALVSGFVEENGWSRAD
ncbi:arsenate reductase ArsC [Myxococcus landrumensis]|uniref:Arsenate reductase ArsC n=1 Tax=Myxococcus landrumensis TaxID=2813577 RepID=A0ABX7MWF9_9BACT|nr:arsenate reductase ArsC [Myxococcus landrumus]QSQ10772.1 arsenate reductase ArsC [Myxococcus landrumus]